MDEREVETIKSYADSGYQMYNVTAGSQSKGKVVSDNYKQPKTYREGIQAGRKALAKELSGIIDKHLTVDLKPEKQNSKVSIKAFDKFKTLLSEAETEV